MSIKLGKYARKLRNALGLTQKEMAEAMDLTNVYLSHIETDKAFPSQHTIDTYRELTGVDLYVLAWCEEGDCEKLPAGVRVAARKLTNSLRKQLGSLLLDGEPMGDS